jgi:small subunit ribosomal protein S3
VGNKTHPIGFRLGIIKDWQARWFASKQSEYRALVIEDLKIRNTIASEYPDAGISRVDIERTSNDLIITVHTARPGIVIGRGGQKVEELRKVLEGLTDRRARLNVQEIRQPELDAFIVARSIADQLVRRIAYRRAIRQGVTRTMQAGAEGVKIICSGRLGGADIARREKAMDGRVPLHTLRADIDFSIAEAATEFGRIGVKVWIYKGEVLPKQAEQELEDMAPIEVTLKAADAEADEIGPIAVTVKATAEPEPEPEPKPEAEPEPEPEPEPEETAEKPTEEPEDEPDATAKKS